MSQCCSCVHCWLYTPSILCMFSLSGLEPVDLETPVEQWLNACCMLNNLEAYGFVCVCVCSYFNLCIISEGCNELDGKAKVVECVLEACRLGGCTHTPGLMCVVFCVANSNVPPNLICSHCE